MDARIKLIRIHVSEAIVQTAIAELIFERAGPAIADRGGGNANDFRGAMIEAKNRLHESERLLDGADPALYPALVKEIGNG
jgi:hypothetical protein